MSGFELDTADHIKVDDLIAWSSPAPHRRGTEVARGRVVSVQHEPITNSIRVSTYTDHISFRPDSAVNIYR